MLKFLGLLPSPLLKRLINTMGLVRNPYSLGVRVLVRNEDGEVLLVRHTYVGGWYLPGGGVDKGEVMAAAAARELSEEAGIRCMGMPVLRSVYLNRKYSGRDHIALYEALAWEAGPRYLSHSAEIAEARFFPLAHLPRDLSPATARRLTEVVEGRLGQGGDGFW